MIMGLTKDQLSELRSLMEQLSISAIEEYKATQRTKQARMDLDKFLWAVGPTNPENKVEGA